MIAGIILAAGMSVRMGQPKMLLPWKDGRTVLGQVAHVLRAGGVDSLLIVTGPDREEVEQAARGAGAIFVHNEDYANSGMFSSIKLGLRALETMDAEAALITPGDLPAVEPGTVSALVHAWRESSAEIAAPSREGRRGHPVLVARSLWPKILSLTDQATLRDFLMQESASILHVVVDDPGIDRDLDTPEDYRQSRGQGA